jgi:hypothetical protein
MILSFLKKLFATDTGAHAKTRKIKKKKTIKKLVKKSKISRKKIVKKSPPKKKKTSKKSTVKKTKKAVKRKTKASASGSRSKTIPKKKKKISEKEIGRITHYFGKISVGIIKLKKPLKINEAIHIKGASTDFIQIVTSMQVNHKEVPRAAAGAEVGIKVIRKVHYNDKVCIAA